jgi:hypothetical protein
MIRPNDIVLHKPSGETWVVCGVDHSKGELIPCGYPFPTLAKVSDCELIEEGYTAKGQPEEYIKALQKHGLDRFIDVRSAMFHGII